MPTQKKQQILMAASAARRSESVPLARL